MLIRKKVTQFLCAYDQILFSEMEGNLQINIYLLKPIMERSYMKTSINETQTLARKGIQLVTCEVVK